MDHPKNSVYRGPTGTPSRYGDIRRMLAEERVMDAELLLDSIPDYAHDGEWHYLKGGTLQQKGLPREAARHFAAACRLDPANEAYQQAANTSTQGQNDDGKPALGCKIRQFFRFW